MAEINANQVRATADYLARLVGCVVVDAPAPFTMPDLSGAETERLRRLVGDENVDGQWRGRSRSDVIALAEEHFAAADSLRADRAAMWELLKLAARTYRENDEIAMDELGVMERERDRLRAELDQIAEQGHDSKRCDEVRDVIVTAFITVQQVLTAVDKRLTKKPAEASLVEAVSTNGDCG